MRSRSWRSFAQMLVAACRLNPSTCAHSLPITNTSTSAGAPRMRMIRRPRHGPVATTPRADASATAARTGALSMKRLCAASGSRSASARSTRRKIAATTRATSSSVGAGWDGTRACDQAESCMRRPRTGRDSERSDRRVEALDHRHRAGLQGAVQNCLFGAVTFVGVAIAARMKRLRAGTRCRADIGRSRLRHRPSSSDRRVGGFGTGASVGSCRLSRPMAGRPAVGYPLSG